jgi:quercetin dioxygenase-like cupin family protein
MIKKFYLAEETLYEDIGNGLKRQLLGYDERIMMLKVDFKLNTVGPLHSHMHSQSTYILSGIFDVTIDGETKVLKEGDSFFVPSGQTHGVICKQAGSLLDVFSPAREEYLSKQ